MAVGSRGARPFWWRCLLALWAVAGPIVSAQSGTAPGTPAQPAFEAVSIHMVASHGLDDLVRGEGVLSMSTFPTNYFYLRNAPLAFLVQMAYQVDSQDHIAAMPEWMESQEYSVAAKVEGQQALTLEQIRPLLQRLLRERFHFAAHIQTRSVSGFALVVGKGGSRLKPSGSENAKPWAMVLPDHIAGGHMHVAQLAGALAHHAGQPVIDRTELPGLYDFEFSFAPANDPHSDLPDFFTALREELGLDLRPEKVPVAFLVVDHVDRTPTEN